MKFKTVCYLLVQLMHCRKMFKAEIPFSNVMTCEDDDKVCVRVRPPGPFKDTSATSATSAVAATVFVSPGKEKKNPSLRP